jgi:transposase
MAQTTRVVGLDVAKRKIDACIRSAGLRLSAPSTPEGQAELVAWLRVNRVRRAVMEASGGYERPWSEALRAAGIKVRIVDPKRVRHFAKAAGRLAKNDPIDAETIAWFAETVPDAETQPHDPERDELNRLVQARAVLTKLEEQIRQQREHRQPTLVTQAHAAIAKILRAERRKFEAAIAAKIKANPEFAQRAELIKSVPGLADHAAAGLIAWLPELGHITNQAAAALVGSAPYDDDSGEHKACAVSGAAAASCATSFICWSWGPPPSTTRCSSPTTSACAPKAKSQGCSDRLHAQAHRHPQHHAGAKPEMAAARRRRCGMSERTPPRSALRVDRMIAPQPGEPTGSRPKPRLCRALGRAPIGTVRHPPGTGPHHRARSSPSPAVPRDHDTPVQTGHHRALNIPGVW